MKRWAWALWIATLAPNASAAPADSIERPDAGARTVVLLRSSASDDVTTEATARVQGELGAAGFHVEVVAPRGDDARQELETAGSALHAIAAFAIVVRPSGGRTVAEIWVSDRMKQTMVIQRAELTGTDHLRESEILAVRAVELLKASLSELWIQPAPPPLVAPNPAPSPAVQPSPQVPRMEGPRPVKRAAFAAGPGVGLGVSLLDGFVGEVAAVWAPEILVSYGWESGVALRLGVHGLGPAAVLNAPAGTARVEEQFGSLDVVKTWWPRWPVVPFACVGVGAQHVHVSGEATLPTYEGTSVDYWAPLTSAGLGAAVPVHSGISIVVQGRALLAWPPTEVRIAQVDAGRFGGPSVLVDAHVLGVFP